MATVLISYDLNRPGQDYSALGEKIKSLAYESWRPLTTTWLIVTDSTATHIRDTLLPYIDKNDELLVIGVGGKGAAWYGFNQKGSDWLTTVL